MTDDLVPTADNDVPEDDPGTHPTADPDAPDDPTPAGDDEGDEARAAGTEDDEPEEWRYLADRFKNIEDERERRAAIGRTFLEKTRFASEVRRENEELRAELEKARAARRPEPAGDEPPPDKHPDVLKLDARITRLTERQTSISTRQEQVLADLRATNDQLAVAKHELQSADETDRRNLEREVKELERAKSLHTSRFEELQEKLADLADSLADVQDERQWALDLVSKQRTRQENERTEQQRFQKEFPEELARNIDSMADSLKIPKDLREELRATALPRLAVAFWKADKEGLERIDVEGLVQSEVRRFAKSRDLLERTKFGKDSRERLEAAGPRGSRRRTVEGDGGEPTPKTPAGRNPLVPIDVSALGVQSDSPTLQRGRKHLADRGY